MIKNVIFDMDGVLRIAKDESIKDIMPVELLKRCKVADLGITLKEYYKKYITTSSHITDFDTGKIGDDELSELICHDYKLDKETFSYLLNLRLKDEVNVYFEQCFNLIKELKEAGCNVYVLSNMNIEMSKVLKAHIGNDIFNDMIFSCDIGLVKPNLDIYEYAMKKWNILPKDSIFIDDSVKNLRPFMEIGGMSFQFDRFNIDSSIKKLKRVIFGSSGYKPNSSQVEPEESPFDK